MNKFGELKSKVLVKLTESYENQNKTDVKDILLLIKENKDFRDVFLFYDDIENKYFNNSEAAKLYVEEVTTILKEKIKLISEITGKINKRIGNVETTINPIYECLDRLCEKDTLSNVDKKIEAKLTLIEHLTKEKEPVIDEETNFTVNENVLFAVLSNNFNVLYENSLTDEEKSELQSIVSLSNEEIQKKVIELKESTNKKLTSLLLESTNDETTGKLLEVQNEIKTMSPTKYNLYKLTELEKGL